MIETEVVVVEVDFCGVVVVVLSVVAVIFGAEVEVLFVDASEDDVGCKVGFCVVLDIVVGDVFLVLVDDDKYVFFGVVKEGIVIEVVVGIVEIVDSGNGIVVDNGDV